MNKQKISKTHHQHHDQSDCGVVCLKSILNFYGSDLPIEQLREWSGTNRTGTTMLGLLQCAKRIGFEANGFEADIDSLKECTDICILHVLKNKILQHFVVCYCYNPDTNTFLIGDPANSKPEYINEDKLKGIWQSKALIRLKATKGLPKSRKENKLKWIVTSLKKDLNILSMALFLGVVTTVLGLSSAVFSQKFIDRLLPSKDFNKVFYGSLLLLFLMLVSGSLNYIKQLFLIRQGRDYNIRIIDFFYTKMLNLPKQFFDTRKTGDLVARMNDTNRIQSTIINFFSSIIVNLLMVIVSSIAIFSYNTNLGMVSLIWIPLFLMIVFFYHPKILKIQQRVMHSYSQNESNYIDTISGIEEIKSNNKQSNFSLQTQKIYSDYKHNVYDLGKIGLQYQFVTSTMGAFFVVGLIVYASFLVFNNQFTSGGVIAMLQLSSMLMSSVAGLAILNIQLQEAKVALNRMFEYTRLDNENNDSSEKQPLKISNIELRNIGFGYPGRLKILKDVSASISKGQCLGIIGEIGTGKSTLIQIIQKFYFPNSGSIIINNAISLEKIDTKAWRDCIGVVSQHTHLFTGNIFYNISLEEGCDRNGVIEFCTKFGFDKFINVLPQSYYTIVGEEGVNLSGGQRQIIAIARCLYKSPQLILLDEVSSSMDSKTETFIIDVLKEIKKEALIIFASHNFQTLDKIADKTLSI